MGSIEIPKISVDLAIYHGTGQKELEKGVGHVQGTSLPIGGSGTHVVLAAHRGLPNAKLFTDLDQLEIGDKFFLHILNETLAYEVDQIKVVEPDDLTYVQIEEGQDLVTLLTCTPYGVNTQRLLVRGHRIPYVPEDVDTEKDKHEVHLQRDEPVRYFAAGIMVVLIAVTVIRSVSKHRSK
jgi:sortase A